MIERLGSSRDTAVAVKRRDKGALKIITGYILQGYRGEMVFNIYLFTYQR